MENWKTAQVQRGATMQARPSPIRMRWSASTALELVLEMGWPFCPFEGLGGRSGSDWLMEEMDDGAILIGTLT